MRTDLEFSMDEWTDGRTKERARGRTSAVGGWADVRMDERTKKLPNGALSNRCPDGQTHQLYERTENRQKCAQVETETRNRGIDVRTER